MLVDDGARALGGDDPASARPHCCPLLHAWWLQQLDAMSWLTGVVGSISSSQALVVALLGNSSTRTASTPAAARQALASTRSCRRSSSLASCRDRCRRAGLDAFSHSPRPMALVGAAQAMLAKGWGGRGRKLASSPVQLWRG